MRFLEIKGDKIMRKPQVQGNEKSYYIEEDYIDIWKYEDDFVITKEDLPFLKKAIKLLEKKK
jgi:hypothetical protein